MGFIPPREEFALFVDAEFDSLAELVQQITREIPHFSRISITSSGTGLIVSYRPDGPNGVQSNAFVGFGEVKNV